MKVSLISLVLSLVDFSRHNITNMYQDLVKLRVQTMEANRNSRHTTNNIKWEEARTVPSGHGQRS